MVWQVTRTVFAAPLDGGTVDKLRRAFDAELSGRVVGTVLRIRRQVFGCNGSAVCESVYELICHKDSSARHPGPLSTLRSASAGKR